MLRWLYCQGPKNYVCDVRFSPDGQRLASLSGGRRIWVWDAQTYKCIEVIQGNGDVAAIVAGPKQDPNHRKKGLRLDVRESAVKAEAIVPGKPEKSGLVERIFADDPDDLMPPPESHRQLTEKQKQLLKR